MGEGVSKTHSQRRHLQANKACGKLLRKVMKEILLKNSTANNAFSTPFMKLLQVLFSVVVLVSPDDPEFWMQLSALMLTSPLMNSQCKTCQRHTVFFVPAPTVHTTHRRKAEAWYTRADGPTARR